MARSIRIQAAGAFYHVMARGERGQGERGQGATA